MTWHELPELPKPDTEVLAEVEGFISTRYMVVFYDSIEGWKQSLPVRYVDVKRWAYIEEE